MPEHDEPGPPPNPQRGRPKRQKPLPEGAPTVIRGPGETVVRCPPGSGFGIAWEMRRPDR